MPPSFLFYWALVSVSAGVRFEEPMTSSSRVMVPVIHSHLVLLALVVPVLLLIVVFLDVALTLQHKNQSVGDALA